MQPQHRIEEMIVDLSFSTARLARGEKNKLADWLGNDLLPALDTLFSRYVPGDRILRLDQLEFDLGIVDSHNYQKVIAERLVAALSQILEQQLLVTDKQMLLQMPTPQTIEPHAPAANVATTQYSLPANATEQASTNKNTLVLQQLFNYLHSGQVHVHRIDNPARINNQTAGVHEQLLAQVLGEQDIAALLRELPHRQALVQRLTKQFSEQYRIELLRQLAPRQIQLALALLDWLQVAQATPTDNSYHNPDNNNIAANNIHNVSAQLRKIPWDILWEELLDIALAQPALGEASWLKLVLEKLTARLTMSAHELAAIFPPSSSPRWDSCYSAGGEFRQLAGHLEKILRLPSTTLVEVNGKAEPDKVVPGNHYQQKIIDQSAVHAQTDIAPDFTSANDQQLFELCLRLKSGSLPWARLPVTTELLARLVNSYIRLGQSVAAEQNADFLNAISTDATFTRQKSGYYLQVLQRLLANELIDLEAIVAGLLRPERTINQPPVNSAPTAKPGIENGIGSSITLTEIANEVLAGNMPLTNLALGISEWQLLVAALLGKKFLVSAAITDQFMTAVQYSLAGSVKPAANYRALVARLMTIETLDAEVITTALKLQARHLTWQAISTAPDFLQRLVRSYIEFFPGVSDAGYKDLIISIESEAAATGNKIGFYQRILNSLFNTTDFTLEKIANQQVGANNAAGVQGAVKDPIDKPAQANIPGFVHKNENAISANNGPATHDFLHVANVVINPAELDKLDSFRRSESHPGESLEGLARTLLAGKIRPAQLELSRINWQQLIAVMIKQKYSIPAEDTSNPISVLADLLSGPLINHSVVVNHYHETIARIVAMDALDAEAIVAGIKLQMRLLSWKTVVENPALFQRILLGYIEFSGKFTADSQRKLIAALNARTTAITTDSRRYSQLLNQLFNDEVIDVEQFCSQLAQQAAKNSIATPGDHYEASGIDTAGAGIGNSDKIQPTETVPILVRNLLAGNVSPAALELSANDWQHLIAGLLQFNYSPPADEVSNFIAAIERKANASPQPSEFYRQVSNRVLSNSTLDLEEIHNNLKSQNNKTGFASTTIAVKPVEKISSGNPEPGSNHANNLPSDAAAGLSRTGQFVMLADALVTGRLLWADLTARVSAFSDADWLQFLSCLFQTTQTAAIAPELQQAIARFAAKARNKSVYYTHIVAALLVERSIDLEAFAALESPPQQSNQSTQAQRSSGTLRSLESNATETDVAGSQVVESHVTEKRSMDPDSLESNLIEPELLTGDLIKTGPEQNTQHPPQHKPQEMNHKQDQHERDVMEPVFPEHAGQEILIQARVPIAEATRDPASISLADLLVRENPGREQLLVLQQQLNKLLHKSTSSLTAEWLQALTSPEFCVRLIHAVPSHLLHQLCNNLQPRLFAPLEQIVKLVSDALALLLPQLDQLRLKQAKWEFIFQQLFAGGTPVSDRAQLARQCCLHLAAHIQLGDIEPLMQLTQRRLALSKPSAPLKPAIRLKDLGLDPAATEANKGENRAAGLAINNAGQVLIASYLPRLFSMLNLTGEGKFIHSGAADRAAHLVQFIVNGQMETPEYELPLNKILCGISTSFPLSPGIVVTEQEQALIEQMLTSIIQHWKVLGSTSIAGLRETFFQRQGWLVLEEDCWRLKVQERSFDMLLDHLPWSIALIKHGWMDKPLRVSWRNHS
jgi:hypothetical protein